MFLVASVIAPAVATADTGGTNTIKVLPATTTITPVGTGSSFTVNIVANGSVPISGAGAGVTFDNTKLTLTNLVKDPTEVANGAAFAGFPSAANLSTFIATANSTGSIPVIAWSYTDGVSNETANADHGIYTATFTVTATGDNTLALVTGTTGGLLDGTAASYGTRLTETLNNGNVVNHVAPVFSISAPGTASVNRGANQNVTVATAVVSGSPANITFSTGGLPSGVSASFAPNPAAVGVNSTLTFTANAVANTGTFPVTVNGVDSADATDAHSTTIQLTVVAPNDYSLSATPGSVTVSAGGAASNTNISVTQLTPTAGTVNLSVTSAAITGVTTTLTTGSATIATPDTLSIAASAAAVPGSYTITITGDNGTNTHTVSISLTVNGAAPPNAQDVNVSGTLNGGFIGLTCPTSMNMPLLRGNTNHLTVPCAVNTNTMWALNVNDTATDAQKGFMVTGRPVDNVSSFQMPDSMHVLADSYISGGDVFYHNDVNLVAGGTILTGTNTANAPLVLSQFVAASTHPGSYSIQLLFSALSTF
jgi:hypothetical protein